VFAQASARGFLAEGEHKLIESKGPIKDGGEQKTGSTNFRFYDTNHSLSLPIVLDPNLQQLTIVLQNPNPRNLELKIQKKDWG
jgi:hypothetical protein